MQVAPAVSQPRFPSAVTDLDGELLIDLAEDKAARTAVFGLLAEMEKR
jgi:hypothetical protein